VEVSEEIKKVRGMAVDPPPTAMSGSSLLNFVRRAQEEDSSSDEEDGKTQCLQIRGRNLFKAQSLSATLFLLCHIHLAEAMKDTPQRRTSEAEGGAGGDMRTSV
jgi:hypothetical protein